MLKLSTLLILPLILTGCFSQRHFSLISGAGFTQNAMIKKELKINGQTLTVEVAQSLKEQSEGLSGRNDLCQNCAMLFPYSDFKIRDFWMKGMEFFLDIIWIKDSEIVGFSENTPVLNLAGEISRVQSPEPVDQVLEIKAGWVKENGVKIGDKAEWLD